MAASLMLPGSGHSKELRSPADVYGALFEDVQRGHVFPDQKTFPDASPRQDPAQIIADYARLKEAGPVSTIQLRQFIERHFVLPSGQDVHVVGGHALEQHIEDLWSLLQRKPDMAVVGSSLLPLPQPYIVPGGRFREVYYWDSYFTMLGLRESGREDLIESMIRNFAFLIEEVGFIPNGNRTYYLSRSQPPFFALMVELLADKKGTTAYIEFLPSLQREHDYWMDKLGTTRHRVALEGGEVVNRYFDTRDYPREESFTQDEELGKASGRERRALYRDIRSAAESGWDFSSRWFADGKNMSTIATTEIAPVDLHCLLLQLEKTLATAYEHAGQKERSKEMTDLAEKRKSVLHSLFWDGSRHFFFDYSLRTKTCCDEFTLAGVAPLFLNVATNEEAFHVSEIIRSKFLRPGGVVTTTKESGEQWDAPNGWAPLEWMTIQGLENYGYRELAADIAHRWIALNRHVYEHTGKLMEKYNVEDLSLVAGGGEYPTQDGFGWTNGVLLKLIRTYGAKK